MIQLEDTGDGSPTLYSSIYNAAYHSRRGALSEGFHVFIQNGIEWYLKRNSIEKLYILEMGLGSGLNAFLAARYATLNNLEITYTGIEKHPVPLDLNREYAGVDHLRELSHHDLYEKIIEFPWEEQYAINQLFSLRKCQADFCDFKANTKYDIIFYDAFGPRAQPELWDMDICESIYKMLNLNGILTTFCAQGQFKRNLKAAGLTVHTVEGALGKREMVIAEKNK